jgi:UDPglucose 6-dehydrogenase
VSIVVVGTGYVGLVTGACLSEVGHSVVCVDVDADRIKRLSAGEIPFHEPGLAWLVRNGLDSRRLSFTTSLPQAYAECRKNRTLISPTVMIAVGTPSGEDGSADTGAVLKVADEIGKVIDEYTVVAMKSTVPVGTCEKVADRIRKSGGDRKRFDVVSNPEFLKEGAAVEDFMRPARIIVGSASEAATKVMLDLFRPFNMSHDRMQVMGLRESEMTKYAANAMLATKISFMNEVANLCDRFGVDVDSVRRGIGSDPRIGHSFIYAGAGYGGSCFPKDVRALIHMAESAGLEPLMLGATHRRNEQQKKYLLEKIFKQFGNDLAGLTFAVWGLSFKPGTDDVREAPAATTILGLIDAGASVRAFDPIAAESFERSHSSRPGGLQRFTVVHDKYEALDGASALVLVTEWKEFRSPDFSRMRSLLSEPIIFDGRNQFDAARLRSEGWTYVGVGRPATPGAAG